MDFRRQKLRMLASLSCLVASMTATAALLGWLDPGLQAEKTAFSPEEIEEMVDTAIAEGVNLRRNNWVNIELVPVNEPDNNEGILAAETLDSTWHFHIKANGFPVQGLPWLDQRPVDRNHPGTIKIAVDLVGLSPTLSQAQGRCVRTLLAKLSQQLSLKNGGIPVKTRGRS